MEPSNLQTDFPPLETLLQQRPPFLFIDHLISFDAEKKILLAQKTFSGTEAFYQGHFPQYPLTPGVLLCEAIFQLGSVLLSLLKTADKNQHSQNQTLGVVTKIDQTRFKQMVLPGDELLLKVEVMEQLEAAFYMKGSITTQNKKVMQTQFVCTLTPKPIS